MSLILTDIAIRRQVLLERFKAAEVRKFTPILRKIDEEIRRQLSGNRLTDFRRARLEQQLATLKTALGGHYQEFGQLLAKDLEALAVDTAAFERGTLTSYVPKGVASPAPQQLWAAVTANPLTMTGANGGQLLESFMASWADGDAEMVSNAVRMGYALGETNDQILARIRGDAALNFSDGVLAKSRSHAEAVTRTAIQHVANSARAQVWEANDDIIDEYQWVSTLDSRTTPLCRDRDGQKFPVGKGPLPPAHPNCRSTTVAVIKGEFGRLLEEEGNRAAQGGPVPAGETYYDWLKRQPHDFQDLALGPTRGKLFRDGGLTTDQFSKLQLGKNFEPMTLEQMRTVAPGAFAKAGIDPPPAAPVFGPAEIIGKNREYLTNYSGSFHRNINKALREGGGGASKNVRNHIAGIASLLDRSGLAEDATLYRGLDAKNIVDSIIARRFNGDTYGAGWDFFNNFKPEDLVGEVFDDAAFMSFSKDLNIARNFSGRGRLSVTMRLQAKAGQPGYIDLDPVARIKAEREVLRKGGRFRIVGWDPDEKVLLIEALP